MKIGFLEQDFGVSPQVNIFRGNVLREYHDNDLFHNHNKDEKGSPSNKYSLVQYRVKDKKCYILLLTEKPFENISHWMMNGYLKIDNKTYHSKDCNFKNLHDDIIETDEEHDYVFQTPYLPLNSNNYKDYQKLDNPQDKIKFINNRIHSHILGMCSALGYRLKNKIDAKFYFTNDSKLKEKIYPFKDKINQLGVMGGFKTNLYIPNDLAIGKSVSFGYGWLKEKEGQQS